MLASNVGRWNAHCLLITKNLAGLILAVFITRVWGQNYKIPAFDIKIAGMCVCVYIYMYIRSTVGSPSIKNGLGWGGGGWGGEMGWGGLLTFKYAWRTDVMHCDATLLDVHLHLRMYVVLRWRCLTSRTGWGWGGVLKNGTSWLQKTKPGCKTFRKPEGKKLSVVKLHQISHFKPMANTPSCAYMYIISLYIYNIYM